MRKRYKMDALTEYVLLQSPDTEAEAKELLTQVCRRLKKAGSAEAYQISVMRHFSYLHFLPLLREELEQKHYMTAWRELQSIFYKDFPDQPRMWYSLIELLSGLE